MHKKWYGCALGLGLNLSSFAGTMGYELSNNFYIQGMLDYNWFHYNHAYTASYFGPQNIDAISASMDNQWGFGVGAGYNFNDHFRAGVTVQGRPDVRYQVTDNAPETAYGSFDNYTAIVNGYLSSPTLSFMNFKPYIMGGVGVARNKTSDIFWPLANQTEFGDTTTQLAWQIGAGTLFVVNECLYVDLNYSFVSLGDVRNSGQYNAIAANNVPAFGAPTQFTRVYSNQAELGVHYRFAM